MTDGRRFRILTLIDNCTHECLAAGGRHLAVGRAGGPGVGRDHSQRDRPATIVSDNGTEYTSNAALA